MWETVLESIPVGVCYGHHCLKKQDIEQVSCYRKMTGREEETLSLDKAGGPMDLYFNNLQSKSTLWLFLYMAVCL